MAFEELFTNVASEFHLDRNLLAEIAWRESRFDPKAVGRAGDMGLMQILPSTWQEWAPRVKVEDPFDPLSNIRVAGAYLNWLRTQLVKTGRPEIYWILAAYNWGIGNVLRLLRDGGSWSQVPAQRQDYATGIALATAVRIMADSQAGDAEGGMQPSL